MYKTLLVLPLGMLVALLVLSTATADEARYEYSGVQQAQEASSFLPRLKNDKTKIDLAIENTKTLIDRSRQRPYLPELYLRLAELYIEKSRIVYFIRRAEMPEGVKTLEHLEANTLKKQAIEIYLRVLNDFPNFAYRDKVHFFIAHEYRELGQIEEMLHQYQTIIKEYPKSGYVSEAYLLLGDHFFNLQELQLAKRHYEAILQHQESPALPVARYKLAWCYINEADYKKALELFEGAVKAAVADADVDIDSYRKVDIKLESLIDMAYCYVEQHKEADPEEALSYFESYSWSRPVFMIALEKLASRYFVKKKWGHAAEIYRRLSTLENDPETLLEYAGKVFECVRAIGTFEQADKDLSLIVKALEKQKYSVHIGDEQRQKNLVEYELFARDIVTHLHQKALERRSKKDSRVAAAAYKAYQEFFADSEVRDEMAMNYAETLFAAEQYFEAGRQFEALAESKLRSEREREENLYSSVLCYYLALKNDEELSAYHKVFARGGLRTLGKQYSSEYPTAAKVPKVLFNVAWVAYNEGKYQVAIDEFSQFVERYPNTTEAKAAVHLILDAYNLLEDYEGLVAYGRKVQANGALDRGLRAEVAGIVKASESKVLTPLTLAAVDNWEQGRRGLIEFAEKHQSSDLGEQALQAVVASSAELRDLKTLFSTAGELVRNYPQSTNVETALNLVIDTSIQVSQFRQLAYFLEEFSRRLPQHASSADFLYQAARIRETLEQYDRANQNYEQLLVGGPSKYRQNGELVMSMAANAMKQADQRAAQKILSQNQSLLKGADRIKAQAQLALLNLEGGEYQAAEQIRKKARQAFDKKPKLRDSAVKDAVAEMEFEFLSIKHREYMALQLGGTIDNNLVRKKGDLLGALLKGYHKIMKMQSPKWALAACYQAAEVNQEFGRFLREAPLPELAEEQQREYAAIVEDKAAGYYSKGEEYLKNSLEMARKWEICDPEAADYFLQGAHKIRPSAKKAPVRVVAIDEQWLKDQSLLSLHRKALDDPKDLQGLQELAAEYLKRGDYRHAILIAQRALEDQEKGSPEVTASLYNTLGVACLYCNDDQLAKDAFEKALASQGDHRAAKLNLAGLYEYYEHAQKARTLFKELGEQVPLHDDDELIHPRSREFYYAFNQFARK